MPNNSRLQPDIQVAIADENHHPTETEAEEVLVHRPGPSREAGDADEREHHHLLAAVGQDDSLRMHR